MELREVLSSAGENVTTVTSRISADEVERLAPDIIVSYGFRFILGPEVFKLPRLGTLNLHVSYLPWNRGADPNFWSHLEGTPKGVSVHYVDEGIDTGDVIARREVEADDDDTLKTFYARLHLAIRQLFVLVWPAIKSGTNERRPQTEKGTFHLVKDRAAYAYLLTDKGWDTPIGALQGLKLNHAEVHARAKRL